MTLDGNQVFREPFQHDGDLRVRGHLQVNSSLAVTGSWTVGGVLTDYAYGCRITVNGDVTATGVFRTGDLYVGGEVTADVIYCVAFPRKRASLRRKRSVSASPSWSSAIPVRTPQDVGRRAHVGLHTHFGHQDHRAFSSA